MKRFLIHLVAGFWLLAACTNPFTTRSDEVEPPDTQANGSYSYDPAINPDLVFVNFRKSINQKKIEEYMRCLIPDQNQAQHKFTFDADPYFKDEFSTRPWTLDDERNYFTQLILTDKNDYPYLSFEFADSNLSLRPITPTSVNDSLETNSVSYRLIITYSPDSVVMYQGQSRFKIFKLTTPPETWHIYYWQDVAVDKNYDRCWTFLKLYFRKNTKS